MGERRSMKTSRLGGREVPVIGLGTWRLEDAPHDQAIAALRAGLELGATHIDTAEMYGSGRVEEWVGEACAGRRDQVFLASKVMPSNASRDGVVRACERSLRRLGTDRLDLYLLHWPGRHPLEATLEGFDRLLTAGKILAYGVSNFDARQLEHAAALAGPDGLACNQVLYHLHHREAERTLLPICQRLGVALVGYTPFGDGRFAQHPVVRSIAAAHHATAHQIALAFLVRKLGTLTIPKAITLEHVAQNLSAGAVSLSEADLGALEEAFP